MVKDTLAITKNATVDWLPSGGCSCSLAPVWRMQLQIGFCLEGANCSLSSVGMHSNLVAILALSWYHLKDADRNFVPVFRYCIYNCVENASCKLACLAIDLNQLAVVISG